MTHSDIVEFFLYNNIAINSLVKIQLLTGENFVARIADKNVSVEYDSNGEIINSIIKIINPEITFEYKITHIPIDLLSSDIKDIYIVQ